VAKEIPLDEFYRGFVARQDVTALIESSQYGLRASGSEVGQAQEALAAIGRAAVRPLIEALDHFAIEARMAVAQQMLAPRMGGDLEFMRNPIGALKIDQEIQRRLKQGAPHPCMPPASTLALIGEECVQPLIEYLEEERDWLSREVAVGVLGRVGDRRAIPILKKLVRFLGRDRVSEAARRAIRAIESRR
jgi:HEAT repeat protein